MGRLEIVTLCRMRAASERWACRARVASDINRWPEGAAGAPGERLLAAAAAGREVAALPPEGACTGVTVWPPAAETNATKGNMKIGNLWFILRFCRFCQRISF